MSTKTTESQAGIKPAKAGIKPANMDDYKIRMISEYKELKEKYNKLHRMLVKHEAGTLEFKPTCDIGLLEDQAYTMGHYLNILEIRAEAEGIGYDTLTSEE